jgi:rifampicin phosphotransferase
MIISLDSEAARDPAIAGGKGGSLAQLRAAGFPVPDGFVVTSQADASEQLAAHLHALGPGVRFAVRSSGRAEDSAGASFAGQFDTMLDVSGVDEITKAIRHCFASFSGVRAQAYRQGHGLGESGGAVVVQRMVNAHAAGVAFSIDPVSGADDRVVIDAAVGLGEAVVGGRITPDSYTVHKRPPKHIERRLAGDRPCLDDAAVRAVAELTCRVEAHRGAAVDIEWAWQSGQVFLLQARPITAAGSARRSAPSLPPVVWIPELNTDIDPRFPLYSNGNVSEILPGCVTPLTYSVFSKAVERSFRHVAQSVGSMPDVGPAPIVVGFFYHRMYLNVSYFMMAADNSPGATRDTVYEDLIGPPLKRHPAWEPSDFLPWRLWNGARMLGRFLALQKRLEADIAACRQRYQMERHKLEQLDPAQRSSAELAHWMAPDESSLLPAVVHIRASQFATSSFSTLRALTRKWLGDENGSLASSLVTGIGSLGSANPACALYALAQAVVNEPALLGLFTEEADDARLLRRLHASSDPPAARFAAALSDFIARFGHRGFREAEFRSLVWAEQPSAVLAQVRVHLTPGSISPDTIAKRQRVIGEDALRQALSRLSGWRRGFFNSVLRSARKHIAAREEMKDLLLRFLHLTRQVITASKERLADTLCDPDDIYFLLHSEVAAILRGEWTRDAVQERVRARRQDFEWCLGVCVPKVQEGVARCFIGEAPDRRADSLAGVPVSPGVAEGHARVVLDPTHATIAPGEILVAPVTDVAWTPLFLRAAALVVDVGGPLSHGSIVAREYGIPAVTAVAGATRRIRSGDFIRVDGSRGTVVVLSQA